MGTEEGQGCRPGRGYGEYGFACIEGYVFGARPRGVSAPPGPLMSLALAKVAPPPPKSRRLFRDVRPGHTQRPIGMIRLFRSGSQICGPFNRHDQVAIGAESFPRYFTKAPHLRGFCIYCLADNKVQNRPWGKLWGKMRSGGGRREAPATVRASCVLAAKRFPSQSVDDALRVARALADEYGKQPTRPIDVAKAMGLTPSAGPFKTITGASIAYGFTEGGYNAENIALTELGRRAIAPTEEGKLDAKSADLLTELVALRILQVQVGE